MIWLLIHSRVRVLIWESWSFLRLWRQKIPCGKDTRCSLRCWLCWKCVTGKSRSVRLSISSLDRSFARWSCWMKACYCFAGQSQLKSCPKCSTSPKTSSRTETISTHSLQNPQHSGIRPCWFQWCTCHGSSVMTLTWSGTSITQWLGPTQDVTMWNNLNTLCLYVCICIRVLLHTYILMQKHIPEYIHKYVLL